MNDNLLLVIYPLFYVFPYFLTRINRWFGLFVSFAFLTFLLFLSPNIFSPAATSLLAWTLLSSFYVIFRPVWKRNFSARIERLSMLREEKEKEKRYFLELKKEIEELAETEKRLSIIYSITKILAESLNIKSASASISGYIREYFSVDKFSFYLFDPFEKMDFELFCGEGSLAAENIKLIPQDVDCSWENGSLRLVLRDENGVLCLLVLPASESDAKELASSARALLSDIYPGLKRLQLFNRIEMLSQTDGLTGLFRRGTFDNRINEEFKRASAFKTSLGLMILDVDHFKQINDTYGHQAGDIILRQTASILIDSVYETDFVARYGGEEFAVVLPRAEPTGAFRKAEYIRERIKKEVFNIGFEVVKVTVSIGLAHYPRDCRSVPELISKADKALYTAKETGRNKVIDFSEIQKKAGPHHQES